MVASQSASAQSGQRQSIRAHVGPSLQGHPGQVLVQEELGVVMDCYYHGYSGSGGRCVGCEMEDNPEHKTFDDRAERGKEARLKRERERQRSFREGK